MNKLTNFLSAEQVLNKECLGIKAVIAEIANYFYGEEPLVKAIIKYTEKEWTEQLELDKDTSGFYDMTYGCNTVRLNTKEAFVGIHEIIHGLINYDWTFTKEAGWFVEGLVDIITIEICKRLNIIPGKIADNYAVFRELVSDDLARNNLTVEEIANLYIDNKDKARRLIEKMVKGPGWLYL